MRLVAFKLPDVFRRLTAEGAMTNAFLPVFARVRQERGRPSALILTAEIQIILLLVLSAIVVVAEIFMPAIIALLTPGFVQTPERFEATVTLARIAMPCLLMISLVALWAAVTNAHDRFWWRGCTCHFKCLSYWRHLMHSVVPNVFAILMGHHILLCWQCLLQWLC